MAKSRSRRRAVALAATLVAVGVTSVVLGCGRVGDRRPRHVLLISIDSLRADRLGCYGYGRETSPTIDRLAKEGTLFTHAYSPSPWTLPSHATLLTGLGQRHHGAVTLDRKILPGTPGLASILEERGFRTRGVYSGPYLRPLFGFAEGFDDYVSCETQASEDEITALDSHSDETNPCLRRTVERWAAGGDDQPAFWFLHMWDVHYDYIPPAEYVRRFDPSYRGKLTGRKIAGKGFPLGAKPRDVAHLLARYDAEIRYTDDTIGAMLDALEAAGRLDDTLVVVTSDHGDEFLEHGGKGHLQTVLPESVRIPLVLWGPGVRRGRVVDTPVALQDVAPTILDLLGVPPVAMDGVSLRGLMEGTTLDHPRVLSIFYYPPHPTRLPGVYTMAIRSREGTLLRPRRSTAWVAYDFVRDPLEQVPMPVRDATRAQRAMETLGSVRLSRDVLGDDVRKITLPEAVRRRLKALGYLE